MSSLIACRYAPIQRIDLFRYLAIEHFGGFYLDVDVLLLQPLDALTTALAPSARHGGSSAPVAIFPFERLVDPRVHSTLVEHTGFGGLVGQYAFGATPGHPFLRAILRCVWRASREPEWARVPARPGTLIAC
jgi:mannosyltransferase OCH1-like enzyme